MKLVPITSVILAAGMLAGCGAATAEKPPTPPAVTVTATPTPDAEAQCRAALEKSMRRYVHTNEKSSTEVPDECIGLDRDTFVRLVNEVTSAAQAP